MRNFFRWLIGVPVVLLVVGFAVANRRWVTLSLDPFNQAAPTVYVDLPLWLLFFLGIFVGIVVGWTACWFAQGKWRRASRDARVEISVLQRELTDLRKPVQQSSSNDLASYQPPYQGTPL